MDPRRWSNKKRLLLGLTLIAGVLYYFALPRQLFTASNSTVLLDHDAELLGARIAKDEQWRFPERETVPDRFEKALLRYEDQNFFYHPGIDPLAVVRAAYQNISAGRIVSGASTISMQTIRMSRDEERTFFEKAIEAVLATRLELSKSKEEVLALYASHAPFGGNVVGLDAAAWRYYGKKPEELGWGEAATLAVLPNDPASIHPGKGRNELKKKRDRVLRGLRDQGAIDSTTCRLASLEKLPPPPGPVPQYAPHFLTRVEQEHPEEVFQSSLDLDAQKEVERIVEAHVEQLKENKIYNAAAMVMELRTGKVRAYVGNSERDSGKHGACMDMIRAERSSGSILKPFLYGSMLEEGELLPEQLLPDIPLRINGFSPENFDDSFRGAVRADRALARSLNVPAVHLLQEYGVGRFLSQLQDLGFSTMEKPASHYGLSLILGGGEVKLEELVSIYADLGRQLVRSNRGNGTSSAKHHRAPVYRAGKGYAHEKSSPSFRPPISAGATWCTLEAMEHVRRPVHERGWHRFQASEQIPYKTGTSYGHRDAWAVGVTPDHAVGVWAGNASGEGRSGLTGVSAAAPILFEIFRFLGPRSSFEIPEHELESKALCARSGHYPSKDCPQLDTTWVPEASGKTAACSFHKRIHLSKNGSYRVTASCMDASGLCSESRFVLPPSWEYYYRRNTPSYTPLPPFAPYCQGNTGKTAMALIHPPDPHSRHYLPVGLSGEKSQLVFEASHRDKSEELQWHLGERYLGKTEPPHRMAFQARPGDHVMIIVDDAGNTIRHRFEVMERKRGS